MSGSNVPPGSSSFSSPVAPNITGNPYPPGPPLYGMGSNYDFSYGFMGHNYPPFNGSSVWNFLAFFHFFSGSYF